MPESFLTRISAWKNFLVVKSGRPAQRSSPLDLAMIREENDISDTSKSAKRSCRQKSSDGCTQLGMSVIPSGFTLPSKIGQVLGLEAIATLMGMFMAALDRERVPGKLPRGS